MICRILLTCALLLRNYRAERSTTMAQTGVGRFLGLAVLAACAGVLSLSPGWAQGPKAGGKVGSPPAIVTVEQPDAQRTRGELSELLQRYPPSLQGALALDPSLLSNESYLAPYPALLGYLNNHPEIARNPSFYVGEGSGPRPPRDRILEMWSDVLRSEEHTSELQSLRHLVCRLLL